MLARPTGPLCGGVGVPKVWGSQARLLEKPFVQAQLLDRAAPHCPWEKPGMRDFPGRVWGRAGLGDLGRAWVRQEEASLTPQAWPPRGPLHSAPPTCLGGQHFPSQAGVPTPGWMGLWSVR